MIMTRRRGRKSASRTFDGRFGEPNSRELELQLVELFVLMMMGPRVGFALIRTSVGRNIIFFRAPLYNHLSDCDSRLQTFDVSFRL